MDPLTALEHWRTGRYIASHELAVALAHALDQLDAVRCERDSLAAALTVAQVVS